MDAQKYLNQKLAEASDIVVNLTKIDERFLTDRIRLHHSLYLNTVGYVADEESPQYDTIKIYTTDRSNWFLDEDKVPFFMGLNFKRKNIYIVKIIHELFECIAHKFQKLNIVIDGLAEGENNHDYSCRMELFCLNYLIAFASEEDKQDLIKIQDARIFERNK